MVGAKEVAIIGEAGHLVMLDQTEQLGIELSKWLFCSALGERDRSKLFILIGYDAVLDLRTISADYQKAKAQARVTIIYNGVI